jgi:hypothetical protein
MGHGRREYRFLLGRPERMRQPERPTIRWKDNIKTDV